MRDLNKRAPRIAGLLALALGAVALLALSGVAMAEGHGRRTTTTGTTAATTITDGTTTVISSCAKRARSRRSTRATGKLTIALTGGGTVTGLVTEDTRDQVRGRRRPPGRRDHGGGDNSGPAAVTTAGRSSPATTTAGAASPSRATINGGQNEPGDDNGGEAPGRHARRRASCSTASLTPGAIVGEAELRLEGGTRGLRGGRARLPLLGRERGPSASAPTWRSASRCRRRRRPRAADRARRRGSSPAVTSSSAASISSGGPSKRSSSWICRTRRVSIRSSRRRAQQRTIATLMMSAAVPWITVLTARRSPRRRVFGLPERSSGIGRRRPIRVVT